MTPINLILSAKQNVGLPGGYIQTVGKYLNIFQSINCNLCELVWNYMYLFLSRALKTSYLGFNAYGDKDLDAYYSEVGEYSLPVLFEQYQFIESFHRPIHYKQEILLT